MTAIILVTLFVSALIFWLVLLTFSAGMFNPLLVNGKRMNKCTLDKIFITAGGLRQGMFIMSTNKNNPVLLYLHGGLPDFYLTRKYPAGLEDYFTVAYWEQRGSGLSYSPGILPGSINLNQLVADTKEVTNYLRDRFNKEKIYLMGHSGGSFIGIHAAAEFPELYHAYIGVGQISNQLNSERLAHEFIVKKYREAGNMKMVQNLEAFPVTDTIPYGYLKLRDQAMHRFGVGTTQDMNSVFTGIFIPSLTCRAYTLREKFNLWRSKAQSGVHPLWDIIIKTDLPRQVNKFDIPVYFFHGKNDYTVSYPLAKKYFEAIYAPEKRFYTFENSAHSPHFEEPQRVKEIFEGDVLKRRMK